MSTELTSDRKASADLPVTTPVLLSASRLWADARNRGQPTAEDSALDVDVMLAASALDFEQSSGEPVTIATTNTKHLIQFIDAKDWRNR